MDLLLKGGLLYNGDKFKKSDILILDSKIAKIDESINVTNYKTIDITDKVVTRGFADMHVHVREPGYEYKETAKTCTQAAAKGGYTLICAMPNTKPVPDSVENVKAIREAIDKDAAIDVLIFGSITKGQLGEELSPIDELHKYCCGFSDDGKGVQDGEMMKAAMRKVAKARSLISAHCEEESLLDGGYIHDGEYAKANGHKGISSLSESAQIERDIKSLFTLAKERDREIASGIDLPMDMTYLGDFSCRYHVCHISTKESLEHIRYAKKKRKAVTCETTVHHILLCDEDLEEHGRFKMNPPLRSRGDMLAIREALKDGTIDVIATDHAPHSFDEKDKGLKDSAFGVVGIEISFGLLYKHLVKTGEITIEKLLELMVKNPLKLLGKPFKVRVGDLATLNVIDLEREYTIDSKDFLSKGKSTPHEGEAAQGLPILTIAKGEIAYIDSTLEK